MMNYKWKRYRQVIKVCHSGSEHSILYRLTRTQINGLSCRASSAPPAEFTAGASPTGGWGRGVLIRWATRALTFVVHLCFFPGLKEIYYRFF